jgi:hypothetical protein
MDYIKGYCQMKIWSKTSTWVQLVVNMQHQLPYHALKSPLTSCYLSLELLTMWYSHVATKYQFYTKYYGLVHIFPALVLTIMPISKSIWVSKQEIRNKRPKRKPWSQCFKGWLSTWNCLIWQSPQQNIHTSSTTSPKILKTISDARHLTCLTTHNRFFSLCWVFHL